MWRINHTAKQGILTHFTESTKKDIVFFAEHFSTLIKAALALIFGFLFFVPFFQIISALILLFILWYPEKWRTLTPEKAERKKHIATFSLILSDIIINADTLFLFAASAYISHTFLIVTVLVTSLIVAIIKNTKSGKPLHQTALHHMLVRIYTWFEKVCLLLTRSTPHQVFHFMWYGMISFQIGFMATYDTYIRSLFHFTTSDSVVAGICMELLTYTILFLKWGTLGAITNHIRNFLK